MVLTGAGSWKHTGHTNGTETLSKPYSISKLPISQRQRIYDAAYDITTYLSLKRPGLLPELCPPRPSRGCHGVSQAILYIKLDQLSPNNHISYTVACTLCCLVVASLSYLRRRLHLDLRSPKDDLIMTWQQFHVIAYISPLRESRKGKKALKSHKFDISRGETSTFSFFKVGINIDNISTSHHGTFEHGEKKGILLRFEAPLLTSVFSRLVRQSQDRPALEQEQRRPHEAAR